MKNTLIIIPFLLFTLAAKAQTKEIHISEPIIGQTPDPAARPDTSKIYTAVQKPASFPGGIDKLFAFLQKNSKYPTAAGGQATLRVYVQFVVLRDGSLTNVKVIRGVGGTFDAEAIRLVKASAPWIPGEQNGQKVKQQYVVPIAFAQ